MPKGRAGLVQFLYRAGSVPELEAMGAHGDSRRPTMERNDMTTKHRGACFCGTVQIEVTGEPEVMGYCHCRSCRSWSAAPVNDFTLYNPQAVRVVEGAEHVAMFSKTPMSERQY